MLLTRDGILAQKDLKAETVPVPQWGGDVLIRVLSGKERDAYVMECQARKKAGAVDVRGLKARLVVMACCDADGKRLFQDADAEALAEKSGLAIEALFNAVVKLNRLDPDEQEKTEKN